MSNYIRLLRSNPGFSMLWLAQVISLLGDWFNIIVLSALVSRFTDGSGLAIGGLLVARFLPPMLVGPYAGVLVDRFDRKRILIFSDIARAGIVLLYLLALNSPDMLWLVYVLNIIQFMLSALFEPAQSAIIPSLVPRDDLVIANTLTSVTWSVMLATGAIAGGIVAALLGPAIALIFDAFTFAVAAFLITRIQPRPIDAAALEALTQDTSDGSFMEGVRFMIANPATAAVALVKAGGSIGNVDTLMTIYATQIFVLGEDGQLSLGIMYSAFGLGAILGPLLLNRINDGTARRMRRLVVIGFVWALLSWIILGAATILVIVCLGLMLRAMGGSANWTYSSVIIQKTVPDRFLGRVFALDMAGFRLATVISIFGHGALIDILGVDQIRLVAYGTAVVALVPLVLWSLAVQRMENRETETAPVAGD